MGKCTKDLTSYWDEFAYPAGQVQRMLNPACLSGQVLYLASGGSSTTLIYFDTFLLTTANPPLYHLLFRASNYSSNINSQFTIESEVKMGATDSDIVSKAEAILASAKKYSGDRSQRYALMKQVDLLYQQLEDPMDAMLRQWTFVRPTLTRRPVVISHDQAIVDFDNE